MENIKIDYDDPEKTLISESSTNLLIVIGMLTVRSTHGGKIKITSVNRMFQKLSVAFAQIQSGTTIENLLNKI